MVGKRQALLVATETYTDPGLTALRAPVGDVRALTEVLEHESIGGFEVRQLINKPTDELKQEIEGFFDDAARQDLLLLYVSGHGVLSHNRRFYFATTTTKLTRLRATAVEDSFINDVMQYSRARSIVLILDCCHSGAFARGLAPKSTVSVDVQRRFEGHGRVTLTASTELEYAFEVAETETNVTALDASAPGSLFTRYVVEGLQTGLADLDEDGLITIDELYEYVYARVRERSSHQTPGRSATGHGDIVIASSPRVSPLSAQLRQLLDHPLASVREAGIHELERMRATSDPADAAAIEEALRRALDDASSRVRTAAQAALEPVALPETDIEPTRAPAGVTSDQAEAPATPPSTGQQAPSNPPVALLWTGHPLPQQDDGSVPKRWSVPTRYKWRIGLSAMLSALAALGAFGGLGLRDQRRDIFIGGSARIGSVLLESYDPAQNQTSDEIMHLVYTGLVTYKNAGGSEGTKLIPGLAETMPSISADRRTYTFRLRRGLKYSDGSPVKASDFEHAVKRLKFVNGPGAFSVSAIQGIKARGARADISGITSNDATGRITVKLIHPDGRFLYAIALPSGALTPAAKSPFRPGGISRSKIPGVGPYTMRVDYRKRRLEAWRLVLTKTPGFNIPSIAKGNLDKITVTESAVKQMTQDVIDNRLDFMTEDPPRDLLPEIRAKYADRFRMDPNPSNTYWFFMNETTKPFNKLAVRQAVNYALDSRVLQRIFGGRLQPTCNFLPPAYARVGYKRIDPCPYGDPAGPPNLAKARQLVEQSGYKGRSVTVWGAKSRWRPEVVDSIVDYYRYVLNQIGFRARTKILGPNIYFQTVGLDHTRAQTGFTNLYQRLPHPAFFFEWTLSSKALKDMSNFQFKVNPVVDKGLEKLTPETDPSAVAAEWAKIDRAVIENADIAVYGNELSTSFFSERMDSKNCSSVHSVYGSDWSLFCLKGK